MAETGASPRPTEAGARTVERVLLDDDAVAGKIRDLTEAMGHLAGPPEAAALVGIRTRGDILAGRIRDTFKRERGWNLPLGLLDINLYRDDLSRLASRPLVQATRLEFDVEGRTILLIDDVLFTGRTIRAALDALVDFGRPRAIRLGVLVDRGVREYPIQADFAAFTVPTTPTQTVKVLLREKDGRDGVVLAEPVPE